MEEEVSHFINGFATQQEKKSNNYLKFVLMWLRRLLDSRRSKARLLCIF